MLECPVANCDRCTSSDLHSFHRGCVECASGFALYRGTFNDHCYATCPSGYYKEKNPPTNATICARKNIFLLIKNKEFSQKTQIF